MVTLDRRLDVQIDVYKGAYTHRIRSHGETLRRTSCGMFVESANPNIVRAPWYSVDCPYCNDEPSEFENLARS